MKVFLLYIPFLLISNCIQGQNHNNIWYFGEYAGLDFNPTIPTPLFGKLVCIGRPACISDPNGDLLFYTNGRNVWDRNHNIMPNGTDLLGGDVAAQPALIVPLPNSNGQYFIFTTEDGSTDGGMSYSIVDMNLNAGYGDVISSTKNILVVDQSTDKMAAVLHSNGNDVWVITHKFDSDEFFSFLITEAGISSLPVISAIGSYLSYTGGRGASIKSSNDGNRIILASNSGLIEMFHFNPSSGVLSDFFNIDEFLGDSQEVIDFDFSPNDSLLYMSIWEPGLGIQYLYQYQFHSQLITDLQNPFEANPGGVQLGPDGKIYCKGGIPGALSVIHQPNEPGISCQFDYNAMILLPETRNLSGLPSKSPYSFYRNSPSDAILGNDTSLCLGDTIVLHAVYPSNCDSTQYIWSNGTHANTLQVTEPGIYSLEISGPCGVARDTIAIEFISCLPIVYFDMNACEAYMHNGSNMDYTEFIPSYPSILPCADVTARHVYRSTPQENKHSCTPGIFDSNAMCISSYHACSFSYGREEALIFEINIIPDADSLVQLTGMEFFEKAPIEYTWINGGSGINNYPTKYAIRVLKDNIELYFEDEIVTTTEWSLQIFNFIQEEFIMQDTALLRIELLPYCPVGNGSTISAWDIDEIRFFGGCKSKPKANPILTGQVVTQNNTPVSDARVHIMKNKDSEPYLEKITNDSGWYEFNGLEIGASYTVRVVKNDDILKGVNALDLLLLQKHLLGIQPFENLHQYIAADINHNGHISVIDLLELKKLLLGIYSAFPHNTSWRFGPLHQDMNGSDINGFKEIHHTGLFGYENQILDFLGIKIGDINGDAFIRISDFNHARN